MWQVFVTGKRRRVVSGHTHLHRLSSVSWASVRQRECRVGFHNTGAEKQGGLYAFYTSTSPPRLFSICLSCSLPSLSVCLLPDSQVCQELDLPPFPPSAAGMHVTPPTPPTPLTPSLSPPSHAIYSYATNFVFFQLVPLKRIITRHQIGNL